MKYLKGLAVEMWLALIGLYGAGSALCLVVVFVLGAYFGKVGGAYY